MSADSNGGDAIDDFPRRRFVELGEVQYRQPGWLSDNRRRLRTSLLDFLGKGGACPDNGLESEIGAAGHRCSRNGGLPGRSNFCLV